MDDEIIIVYGDIWFEEVVIKQLLEEDADIVVGVDLKWEEYYKGRTQHPYSEAEKVSFDDKNMIIEIGKHLPKRNNSYLTGEFMGIIKISKSFIDVFKAEFEDIQSRTSPMESFQNAPSFLKAYLTDFLQYLVNKGYKIKCSLMDRGWYEVDTIQDLNNLRQNINGKK